jgi:hypothetical protein
MVTITVRPIIWYSPISILCEKRPETSLPTNLTPFALAALVALARSEEGLAAVSMPNVLTMPRPAARRPRRGASHVVVLVLEDAADPVGLAPKASFDPRIGPAPRAALTPRNFLPDILAVAIAGLLYYNKKPAHLMVR